MPSFVVVRDEVGAEVERVTFDNGGIVEVRVWKVRRHIPSSITPISMDAAASGTVKGAAWGFVLAGPLGAAVGSMIGGGPKVTFELATAEGDTWRCIAGRSAYLDLKRIVDRALLRSEKARGRVETARHAARAGEGAGKGRKLFWWLAGGAAGVFALLAAIGSQVEGTAGAQSTSAAPSEAAPQWSRNAEDSTSAAPSKAAPILDGAVMAYTPAKYPKTTGTWGRDGLKRINKLMADAARAVSKDGRCEAVESVDLSDVRSKPPSAPTVFVDCTNNRRFYVGEGELGSLAPPTKRLPDGL